MSYTPTNWASTDVVTASRMNALEQAVGEIDMSYTPNVWQDGDVLTASKMNALEQAVASGGGGGDSDFSTAEVTLTNVDGAEIILPIIYEEGELGEESPAVIYSQNLVLESGVYNVPLYKGALLVNLPYNVSSTGDIEMVFEETYMITGDCTIIVSIT